MLDDARIGKKPLMCDQMRRNAQALNDLSAVSVFAAKQGILAQRIQGTKMHLLHATVVICIPSC